MPAHKTMLQHFKKHDMIMYDLAMNIGKCPLQTPLKEDTGLLHAVIKTIIGQQISTKAAASINLRVQTSLQNITPENILQNSIEHLRDCGLSKAKAQAVHAFAKAIVDKTFPYETLATLSDDAITQAFTAIHGIGPWTASMIQLFYLRRPDIFSPRDGGLQRAVKALYGADADIMQVSLAWKPYRSAASWYLWQNLDNTSAKKKQAK